LHYLERFRIAAVAVVIINNKTGNLQLLQSSAVKVLLLNYIRKNNSAELIKHHTGTTISLRHGMQFWVRMREKLVTVCVRMRGDAGQAK